MREFKADHDKKLFIGGLNPTTDENALRAYYGQWGEITDAVVMKDPRSLKSRCFGFITYKNTEAVDEAQANRPHKVDGKEVDCKRAMPREESGPEVHATVKKVFVGRLSRDISNEDLNEYFSEFGPITEAHVVKDKESNKSRGFAFVTFEDSDSVDKVILKRPHIIKGAKTDVRKALNREDMHKLKPRQPMSKSDYNDDWNDPNESFQSSWDQGYNQSYPPQYQSYGYNGSGSGYGGYDAPLNSSPFQNDGFGSYQQQTYPSGPMRNNSAAHSQYSRPAPYANNGWQQR